MDIDSYIARNQPSWDRLAQLTGQARHRVADLAPTELDELVQLYQRTSAQLSYARTYFNDPPLTNRLTRLVAAASGVIYGKRTRSWRALSQFFAVSFPAAVWDSRRFIGIGVALFFVPALAMGVWLTHDQRALDASATPAQRQTYVEDRFEQYYSNQPHALFFTEVTTNNIMVSFLAFAGGAAFCVFGAYLLIQNGLMLGQAAAWMITGGDAVRFFGLILPHGLLELSAICIAGGTGLRLGWSLIAPGDRTRGEALGEQGRRSVVVVLGLMTMFLAAGTIEGFVTGSGLPPIVRVAIGVVAWTTFMAYLVIKGRAAAARGFTGELGELQRDQDRRAVARLDPLVMP
ncbi:MAG TPA: stage II sporulation protein M [Acidimicrobiales bacterium]